MLASETQRKITQNTLAIRPRRHKITANEPAAKAILLEPGSVEKSMSYQYYAALATGSAEIVAFLGQVVATQPAAKPIHIIADSLSAWFK